MNSVVFQNLIPGTQYVISAFYLLRTWARNHYLTSETFRAEVKTETGMLVIAVPFFFNFYYLPNFDLKI